MVRAVIENPTAFDREGWVELTVPEALGDHAAFRAEDGRVWPAVFCRNKGFGSRLYRVRPTIRAAERVVGEMGPPDATLSYPAAFSYHPWVADDPGVLVPNPIIWHKGAEVRGSRIIEVVKLEEHPTHQVIRIIRHFPAMGIVFVCFYIIKQNDPVIDVFGAFIWSTRRDPALVKQLDGIGLSWKELFVLDYATALGAGQCVRGDDEWIQPLVNKAAWQDGGGYGFTGRMLCCVGPYEGSGLVLGSSDWKWSLSSLEAARQWPMVACAADWGPDGSRWLAHRTPRIRAEDPGSIARISWKKFEDLMKIPGKWNANRPLGLSPFAGQTGDQEDFGFTKGTDAITFFDPKWILQARFSVYAEFMRGGMHFEDIIGGELHPLRNTEHPNWVTWGGNTHFDKSISPDRLGKKDEVYGERASATNWTMLDEEHYSENNKHAYLALCEDPLVSYREEFLSVVDYAAQRNRISPMRATGRQLAAWEDRIELATSGEVVSKTSIVINDRVQANLASPFLAAPGPMKVLNIQPADPRKGIVDLQGNPAATTSMWELALCMVGWLSRMLNKPTVQETQAFLALCNTIALYGCFKDSSLPNGGWLMVDDLWYPGNGAAPPPSAFVAGSKQVKSGRGGSLNGGPPSATTDWTFVGVLIASQWLPDGQARNRALECVQWWTGGKEAWDRRCAEWWAAVTKIA